MYDAAVFLPLLSRTLEKYCLLKGIDVTPDTMVSLGRRFRNGDFWLRLDVVLTTDMPLKDFKILFNCK